MIVDWRSLPNGQEKRHAYLASREWAILKQEVRRRSGGKCEHCRKAPGTQTHHQTYARLYRERLEDLLHVCEPCHLFLSGKGGKNPAVRAAIVDPDVEQTCPLGVHPAVFIAIVHLGTHRGLAKVALFFELTASTRDDGQPFVISIVFDLVVVRGLLDLDREPVARFIRDWQDLAFWKNGMIDLSGPLGRPCLVNIVDVDDWPTLANAIQVPAGLPTPKVHHACFVGTTAKPDDVWLEHLPDIDGEPIARIMARSDELRSRLKFVPAEAYR